MHISMNDLQCIYHLNNKELYIKFIHQMKSLQNNTLENVKKCIVTYYWFNNNRVGNVCVQESVNVGESHSLGNCTGEISTLFRRTMSRGKLIRNQ